MRAIELKQRAIKMHMQGYSHKEISEKLNVTPKTLSSWLKHLRKINYASNLLKLHLLFDKLISSENPDIKDIHNLRNVIASIEKRLKTK